MVEKVREGSAGDIELMDSLDRRTRGAGPRPRPRADALVPGGCWSPTRHRLRLRLLDERRRLELLAATNRRTAERLLWAVLADAERPPCPPRHRRQPLGDRRRAYRPAELHQEGYLGLRGMKPPAPYVHHGALL